MGWEDHDGRSYYYRKERSGSRVRSVYVGSGEMAELIARLEGIERERERERRGALLRERARYEREDAVLDEYIAVTETLVLAELLAEGFHTHKREWRRKQR